MQSLPESSIPEAAEKRSSHLQISGVAIVPLQIGVNVRFWDELMSLSCSIP
jgi:hypothetical protein